ncbi:hypothetical protein ABZ897_42125 [Nonomuraea sp. NPDC046802]|uniref:hypothetical protein n=1 Tax=Nonomuraea sp. NPDC046802 TaxID=3154919 RepID=UPI0033F3F4C8
MQQKPVRLAVAGMAVVGVAVLLPAQAAAATAAATSKLGASTVKASASTVSSTYYGISTTFSVRHADMRVAAKATIRNKTKRNVKVSIQTFVQSKHGKNWYPAWTAPKKTDTNVATSSIGWRPCVKGLPYRVKVIFRWGNKQGGTLTKSKKC